MLIHNLCRSLSLLIVCAATAASPSTVSAQAISHLSHRTIRDTARLDFKWQGKTGWLLVETQPQRYGWEPRDIDEVTRVRMPTPKKRYLGYRYVGVMKPLATLDGSKLPNPISYDFFSNMVVAEDGPKIISTSESEKAFQEPSTIVAWVSTDGKPVVDFNFTFRPQAPSVYFLPPDWSRWVAEASTFYRNNPTLLESESVRIHATDVRDLAVSENPFVALGAVRALLVNGTSTRELYTALADRAPVWTKSRTGLAVLATALAEYTQPDEATLVAPFLIYLGGKEGSMAQLEGLALAAQTIRTPKYYPEIKSYIDIRHPERLSTSNALLEFITQQRPALLAKGEKLESLDAILKLRRVFLRPNAPKAQ